MENSDLGFDCLIVFCTTFLLFGSGGKYWNFNIDMEEGQQDNQVIFLIRNKNIEIKN